MSDGPHKSLKMRRPWKRVAEVADNGAFSSEEVKDALITAFENDWREEVPASVSTGICQIFEEKQSFLFRDEKIAQLEALRAKAAGQALAQEIIDCAIHKVVTGVPSAELAVESTADAFSIWGARHARQMEEHYYRKSTDLRAEHVRARTEQAISRISRAPLARQLLKSGPLSAPRGFSKKTGLDDGVQL